MKRIIFILLVFIPVLLMADGREGYYRFPALHATHHGVEAHAEISPDGKTIAFSAQYEGPTEIYTMPLGGGLPTRRTYEGGNALVIGWTAQGKILYRTRYYLSN